MIAGGPPAPPEPPNARRVQTGVVQKKETNKKRSYGNRVTWAHLLGKTGVHVPGTVAQSKEMEYAQRVC